MWAYRRMVLAVAESCEGREYVGIWYEGLRETTQDDPNMRIGLVDAISELLRSGTDMDSIYCSSSQERGETPNRKVYISDVAKSQSQWPLPSTAMLQ